MTPEFVHVLICAGTLALALYAVYGVCLLIIRLETRRYYRHRRTLTDRQLSQILT